LREFRPFPSPHHAGIRSSPSRIGGVTWTPPEIVFVVFDIRPESKTTHKQQSLEFCHHDSDVLDFDFAGLLANCFVKQRRILRSNLQATYATYMSERDARGHILTSKPKPQTAKRTTHLQLLVNIIRINMILATQTKSYMNKQ
jgi:hypothetical protein